MVGRSERENHNLFTNGLKLEPFNQVLTKVTFLSTLQPLYAVMRKETENLEVAQGTNFEFIDSLKNNGTKSFLIFDNSSEEICNSKAFTDVDTPRRHCGLSTNYIKHNLFHQSKLGRDVELQNTHTVLFKSPHDVTQVSRLSAQLGFGSELLAWYRDATSVPCGHLLIDLSP